MSQKPGRPIGSKYKSPRKNRGIKWSEDHIEQFEKKELRDNWGQYPSFY